MAESFLSLSIKDTTLLSSVKINQSYTLVSTSVATVLTTDTYSHSETSDAIWYMQFSIGCSNISTQPAYGAFILPFTMPDFYVEYIDQYLWIKIAINSTQILVTRYGNNISGARYFTYSITLTPVYV